jgi:hypothetical protein
LLRPQPRLFFLKPALLLQQFLLLEALLFFLCAPFSFDLYSGIAEPLPFGLHGLLFRGRLG